MTCLPDIVTIGLPITSSSNSISTSLSLSSESLSYSSTWLRSAVDARSSCGTVASRRLRLTHHRRIGNYRAHLRRGSGHLFNLVCWKEDPCSGIGRICISIHCNLTPHGYLTHKTVVPQPVFHCLFLPFRKLIRRKWSHKPYILERHRSLWHEIEAIQAPVAAVLIWRNSLLCH